MERCHFRLGLALVDKACNLENTLVGRMVLTSKVSAVSVEPECVGASTSTRADLARKLSSFAVIVIVAGLIGHKHNKTRRRDSYEGDRWRRSVDEAIREVHVVVGVEDRRGVARVGDGLGRQKGRLILPLYSSFSQLHIFVDVFKRVLTVKVNSPCSPHTVGVGIAELEVLVYFLLKVEEVRENAAGALNEMTGTGMKGTYPVADDETVLPLLPWRRAEEGTTGEIAVADFCEAAPTDTDDTSEAVGVVTAPENPEGLYREPVSVAEGCIVVFQADAIGA